MTAMVSADDSGDGEVGPDDNMRSFGETVKAAPARAGSSNSVVSPVMNRVTSTTLAAKAARPRTSRPMVTV
ncbi:hypothetical protein [Streptomyces sp. NPDC054849]